MALRAAIWRGRLAGSALLLESPAWHSAMSGKRAAAKERKAACEAAAQKGLGQVIFGAVVCM
eukprot:11511893-Alexandrium_andersonii.AAC.1